MVGASRGWLGCSPGPFGCHRHGEYSQGTAPWGGGTHTSLGPQIKIQMAKYDDSVGLESFMQTAVKIFLEVSGEGIERVNQASLRVPDSSCPEQRSSREQGDQEVQLRSLRYKLLGLHF